MSLEESLEEMRLRINTNHTDLEKTQNSMDDLLTYKNKAK